MAKSDPAFANVKKIIKFLEVAHEEHKLTHKRLDQIQRDLDEIDEKFKYDATVEEERFQLYELQGLIHYLRGDYEKAEHFALDAQDLKPDHANYISNTIPVIISAANRSSALGHEVRQASDVSVVQYLKNKEDSEIVFYRRSPVYVGLMSFLSLNIYNLYWFYKQWRYISLSTKEKTFPILSSIFQIFTTFSLFRKISHAADAKGYKKSFEYGVYASLYIAVLFGGKAVGKLEFTSSGMVWAYLVAATGLSLVTALITAKVQDVANFSNDNYHSVLPPERKVLPGEVTFGIISVGILILFLIGTVGTLMNNVYPRGTAGEIAAAEEKMNSLTEQYNKCSSDLNSEFETLDQTDQGAVDSYNSRYDACENIRLAQNEAVDAYNNLAGY